MRKFDWQRKSDRRVYINAVLDGFGRGLITVDGACRDLRDIVLSSTHVRLAREDERFLIRRIVSVLRSLQIGALSRPQAEAQFETLLTAAVRDDATFLTATPAMA